MTRLTDVNMCIAKIKDLPVTYDAETVQRCIEVLSNAPTIDTPTVETVPIKHGEWVEYPYCLCYEGALTEDDIACSSCGAVFNVIDNCTETFKYCPNCGARMDEK